VNQTDASGLLTRVTVVVRQHERFERLVGALADLSRRRDGVLAVGLDGDGPGEDDRVRVAGRRYLDLSLAGGDFEVVADGPERHVLEDRRVVDVDVDVRCVRRDVCDADRRGARGLLGRLRRRGRLRRLGRRVDTTRWVVLVGAAAASEADGDASPDAEQNPTPRSVF